MSILIKGLEMPKNCLYCPISHWNKLDEITGCEIVIGKKYVDKSDTGFWQEDRPKWCPLVELPSAQTDLITKIQNGIKATDADDTYSCGMRNGMRWCISLIDDKEPSYENCPSAERKGKWIKQEDEQCWWHECSECGDYPLKNSYGHDVLSDFCPNCGADMRGEQNG